MANMSANVPYAKTRQAMLDHASGDTSAPLTPMMSRVLSSAQQASALTSEHGGASLDLHTMKPYQAGDEAYMVGGTPDSQTGKAFPSQLVDYGNPDPKMTAGDFIDTRRKMLAAAQGTENPVFGTWVAKEPDQYGAEGKPHVAIDLSTAYSGQKQADDATLARNESANFTMKDFSEKTNEQIRKERGLGPRPPKAPGQNEIVRRA